MLIESEKAGTQRITELHMAWFVFSHMKQLLRKRTFRQWLICSFVLVLFFILASCAVYFLALHNFEQIEMEAHAQVQQRISILINSHFKEIHTRASFLSNNKLLSGTAYVDAPSEGKDFYRLHMAGEELLDSRSVEGSTETWVYYRKSNCFLDGAHLFYDRQVEALTNELFGLSEAEWIAQIKSGVSHGFYQYGQAIYYFYPLVNSKSSFCLLIIAVDSDLIRQLLDTGISSISKADGMSCLVNEDGVVLSTGNSRDMDVGYSFSELESGVQIRDEKVVGCFDIEQPGWKYVSLVPLSSYLPGIYRLRYTLAIYVIVCLFLSLIATYLVMLHFYKPVEAIETKLKLDSQLRKTDSFNAISDKISGMIETEKQLAVNIKMQKSRTLEKEITTLLRKPGDTSKLKEMLDVEFGVQFNWGVIVAISWPVVGHANRESMNSTDTNKAILNNITSELLGSEFRSFFIDARETIGIIWSNFEFPGSQSYVLAVLEQVRISFFQQFAIRLRIEVSKAMLSPEQLHIAYHQLQVVTDFCNLSELDGVIPYDDSMEQMDSAWNTEESVRHERFFGDFMEKADFRHAYTELRALIDMHRSTNTVSQKQIRMRMTSLATLVISAIESVEMPEIKKLAEENLFTYRLYQASSERKLEEEALSIIGKLADSFPDDNLSINERLVQIDKYTENHCEDQNLSLQDVADKFHLSAAYLSTVYKQQMGISFHTKINLCRISIAKELLLGYPDLVLSLVAEKSGFGSVQTMTRFFKKIEKITPGEYRRLYAKGVDPNTQDK